MIHTLQRNIAGLGMSLSIFNFSKVTTVANSAEIVQRLEMLDLLGWIFQNVYWNHQFSHWNHQFSIIFPLKSPIFRMNMPWLPWVFSCIQYWFTALFSHGLIGWSGFGSKVPGSSQHWTTTPFRQRPHFFHQISRSHVDLANCVFFYVMSRTSHHFTNRILFGSCIQFQGGAFLRINLWRWQSGI